MWWSEKMSKWCVFVLALAAGCSTVQNYRVAGDRESLVSPVALANVLDVTCEHSRFATLGMFYARSPMSETVELNVQTVVQGGEYWRILKLENYRLPTPEEAKTLSPFNVRMLHNGLRLRVAYSKRVGDRLYDLVIAPNGLTAEMQHAFEHAKQ